MKLKVSRQRKILAIALALIVLGVVAAGSFLFDEEVSTGNKIRVGVFDLKVAGSDNPGPIVDYDGAFPGETYIAQVPVTLVGDRSGLLKVAFKNLSVSGGSESTSTTPLWEHFYVSINGSTRSTLKEGLVKKLGYINPGETTQVILTIETKSTLRNEYKGDILNFDLVFSAEQQ